jgi:hypothetical protein
MTAKEQAIDAIRELPQDVDLTGIIRELALMAGTDAAREEIERGEGMDSVAAKEKLREWISR